MGEDPFGLDDRFYLPLDEMEEEVGVAQKNLRLRNPIRSGASFAYGEELALPVWGQGKFALPPNGTLSERIYYNYRVAMLQKAFDAEVLRVNTFNEVVRRDNAAIAERQLAYNESDPRLRRERENARISAGMSEYPVEDFEPSIAVYDGISFNVPSHMQVAKNLTDMAWMDKKLWVTESFKRRRRGVSLVTRKHIFNLSGMAVIIKNKFEGIYQMPVVTGIARSWSGASDYFLYALLPHCRFADQAYVVPPDYGPVLRDFKTWAKREDVAAAEMRDGAVVPMGWFDKPPVQRWEG